MEQIELEQFKQTLESMYRGLTALPFAREQITIETSPDALDEVQSAGDRELAIRRLENDSGRLRSVTEALERIEDGTYGRCTQCEAEISRKRLSAVPWTAYCLECQTAVDRSSAQVTEPPLVRFGGKSLDF